MSEQDEQKEGARQMKTETDATYGVELVAITGKKRALPAMLVAPVAGEPIIIDDRQVTGRAIVPLECDAERAAAIVEVLQMNCEPWACCIYQRNDKGAWKKVHWKRKAEEHHD